MVEIGIGGNQWARSGGTNRGGRQSAAFKKLSKNPLNPQTASARELKTMVFVLKTSKPTGITIGNNDFGIDIMKIHRNSNDLQWFGHRQNQK